MSWVGNRYSASDERCVGMRDINRKTYLLHGELGQARQNFPSIAIFIEPRRQVRWTPIPQCLSLPCLSYRPASFGSHTVGGDASQFGLFQKIFPIHCRHAACTVNRTCCDHCATDWGPRQCFGNRWNICDQITSLRTTPRCLR